MCKDEFTNEEIPEYVEKFMEEMLECVQRCMHEGWRILLLPKLQESF